MPTSKGLAPKSRLPICAALVALSLGSRASAVSSLAYFAWEPIDPSTYTAAVGGISGNLSFSTTGDDVSLRNDRPPTDNAFIATYGPVVQALAINNGTEGSSAAATALVQFGAPLPTGSRLIAFDVDSGGPVNERVRFTRTSGTFVLIDQLESQANTTSVFPSWSAVTGTLTAQRQNNDEASVFDIAGVQSLTVEYLRGVTSGGITGVRFAVGVPVPGGDANLNGRIDPDDFALLDRGFARNLAGRTNGDFNFDGTIDADDYLIIDTSFAQQQGGTLSLDFLAARELQFGQAYVASLTATIPEPAAVAGCMALAGLVQTLCPSRRRRT